MHTLFPLSSMFFLLAQKLLYEKSEDGPGTLTNGKCIRVIIFKCIREKHILVIPFFFFFLLSAF